MDSITTHVNVHTTGHEVPIECQTLVPDSGEPFTLLTIGPVSLYATPDQLRQLRDVIIEFLVDAETEEVPYDDPAWTTTAAGRTTWSLVLRPEGWPALTKDQGPGTKDEGVLLPIAGGCDDVPPAYEPTAADWAEYHAWCETADRIDACNADRAD